MVAKAELQHQNGVISFAGCWPEPKLEAKIDDWNAAATHVNEPGQNPGASGMRNICRISRISSTALDRHGEDLAVDAERHESAGQ